MGMAREACYSLACVTDQSFRSHGIESQFIVPVNSGIAPVRTYRPLENPALFRDFASTIPTPEGILGFANQHGLLLSQRTTFTETASGKTAYGEPINIWQDEIKAMHVVITAWNAINDGSTDVLRNYFTWQNDHTLTARDLSRTDSTGVSEEQDVTLCFGGVVRLTRASSPRMIFIGGEPTQPSKTGQMAEAALAYPFRLSSHGSRR